jgi:AraC family transcriptional regulator, transcriptional activator FtrA
MHSLALAVTDGTPLFELAAACEVFGIDQDLTDPWYDVAICGPNTAEVGGWLRAASSANSTPSRPRSPLSSRPAAV